MINNRVTYSPEDNKIRIYLDERLDRENWNKFKSAGFSWTMKQASDLVATWRVSREDLALSLEGVTEIEDEESTMIERSCDRAERFSMYLDKRRNEALETSEQTEETSGFQSEKKAEAAAKRSDRNKTKALNLWDKAEYWSCRAEAVIKHAMFKQDTGLRQRRIKDIKADLRRYESYNESGHYDRAVNHLKMRLEYETAVLNAQGGGSTAYNYEIGGMITSNQSWIPRSIIYKINRNTAKEITSFSTFEGGCSHIVKIDRVESYIEATEAGIKAVKDFKAAVKSNTPKATKLINLNLEDAEKLQDFLNLAAIEKARKNDYGFKEENTEKYKSKHIEANMQAYKNRSGGDYASCYTVEFSEDWKQLSGYRSKNTGAFKVRCMSGDHSASYYAPIRIMSINDKKTHALPEFVEDKENASV